MVVTLQDKDSSFEKISRQLDDLMDELMEPTLTRLVSSNAWEPQWNIYEMSGGYLICVNLAGVHPEKIDVQVDRGVLLLSGYREKPEWTDIAETPSVHVIEIDWGRFERQMPLPAEVDPSGIKATYRNGYLWLQLPKKVD